MLNWEEWEDSLREAWDARRAVIPIICFFMGATWMTSQVLNSSIEKENSLLKAQLESFQSYFPDKTAVKISDQINQLQEQLEAEKDTTKVNSDLLSQTEIVKKLKTEHEATLQSLRDISESSDEAVDNFRRENENLKDQLSSLKKRLAEKGISSEIKPSLGSVGNGAKLIMKNVETSGCYDGVETKDGGHTEVDGMKMDCAESKR